jgi:hypothetical protein
MARLERRGFRIEGAALVVSLGLGLGWVVGCAPSTSNGWTKPGGTEQELQRDTLDCLDSATQMVASREGPRNVFYQDRYRRCMANRGYAANPAK